MRCRRASEARRAVGGLVVLALLTACGTLPRPTVPQPPVAAPSSAAPSGPPPAVPSAPALSAAAPPATTTPAPTASSSPGPAPSPGRALALLGGLRVQGRGALTGYDRAAFGQPWADADRNGCDTRNDVLHRDLTGVEVKEATRGCVVLRGTLLDPYTGVVVPHERGGGQVEVDHVVALADAWQKGAATWPWAKRVALANDPLDLQATATGVNRAKGSADAATWLPPLRSARCAFAARQVAVKAKYGLGVTAAERDALARLLTPCPDEAVPTSDAPTLAPLRSPSPRPTTPRPMTPRPTATAAA